MEFIAKSDVGKKRTNNEDSMFAKDFTDEVSLYIVADGLGGYESGEVASKMLIETVSSYIEEYVPFFKSLDESRIVEIFKEAILSANSKIYDKEKTDVKYKGMGTTVVGLLKIKENLYYTSIGDTRLYYIDEAKEKITQITVDDTYVNELIKTNAITEEEAKNHPRKHVLTKAVGILKLLDISVKKMDNIYGYFLLCSDGLTNMLKDNEILDVITKNEFADVANELVLKANENGGVDNITVIYIKREE